MLTRTGETSLENTFLEALIKKLVSSSAKTVATAIVLAKLSPLLGELG